MPLQHPKNPLSRAREGRRRRGLHLRDRARPHARAARRRDARRGRLPDRPRRADARRQRAAQPRHLRHHLHGPARRQADGRDVRQEHDRQGRVPADGRHRDALRQHAEPPLQRARPGQGHRLLDDRLERGGDARRPRPQAQLAAAAQGRGQAHRQAQPRHRHQRPGLLGQVRQLLGRGDAPGADGGRPLSPLARGGGQALRREHHRRGRRDGLDVRRQLRGRQEDVRAARRPAGAHRPRHPDPRGRRVRRLRRAVPRPGPRVGLPRAARAVDQRLRAQVRAGVPRRRLGDLARRRGAARGPHLLGQLPGRRHADLRAQLLAARARRSSPSTTTSCASGSRATGACSSTRATWPCTRRRRSRRWGRSSCSRAATSCRCSPSS